MFFVTQIEINIIVSSYFNNLFLILQIIGHLYLLDFCCKEHTMQTLCNASKETMFSFAKKLK
jgi:hypothetical protein